MPPFRFEPKPQSKRRFNRRGATDAEKDTEKRAFSALLIAQLARGLRGSFFAVFGGMSAGGLGGSIPPQPGPLPKGKGESFAAGWGSRPSVDVRGSIVAVRLCFAADPYSTDFGLVIVPRLKDG
jgi:hypothetical protein